MGNELKRDLEADELMKLLRAGKATAEDQTYAANWIAEKEARIENCVQALEGTEAQLRDANAAVLAVEARLADKEADCVRLVHEKMDMFEAKIAAEARAEGLVEAARPFEIAWLAIEHGECLTPGEWEAVRNGVSINDFRRLASLVREDGQ